MLKVGIAGYGIVGKRRRECVDLHPKMQMVAICDKSFNCSSIRSTNTLISFPKRVGLAG